MKKTVLFFMAAILTLPTMAFGAYVNITSLDGIPNSNAGTEGWGVLPQGSGVGDEDNEVTTGCYTGQNWDLEAILLGDGINTITLIGGYNWTLGYGSPKTTAGDLFLAFENYTTETVIGGDNPTSPATPQSYTTGAIKETFGYDYAFDVNWATGSYVIRYLNAGVATVLQKTSYSNDGNQDSNPASWVSGGTEVFTANPGSVVMTTYATDSAVNSVFGTELSGAGSLTDAYNHYAVTFDLSPIWDSLLSSNLVAKGNDIGLFAHITQSCGNDTMFATQDLSIPQEHNVPEPTTMALLAMGLLGTFARKLRA